MTARPATLDDYRWLYANGYMADGLKCARPLLLDVVNQAWSGVRMLDYGGGRGHVAQWFNMHCQGRMESFDPAYGDQIPTEVGSFHWVTCFDVLEHIPESEIMQTLRVLHHLATNGLILSIADMSDVHQVRGEPVELHLIQAPKPWWNTRLISVFPPAFYTIEYRDFGYRERFGVIIKNKAAP